MSGNLGASTLRRHKRQGDPMAAYDALPKPLRLWMAGAALPWSARSCLKIWRKARSEAEALDRLAQAEVKALRRDRVVLVK